MFTYSKFLFSKDIIVSEGCLQHGNIKVQPAQFAFSIVCKGSHKTLGAIVQHCFYHRHTLLLCVCGFMYAVVHTAGHLHNCPPALLQCCGIQLFFHCIRAVCQYGIIITVNKKLYMLSCQFFCLFFTQCFLVATGGKGKHKTYNQCNNTNLLFHCSVSPF